MFWVQRYTLSYSVQGSENKMNPIFKKKFFHSDYQIFISLIKTHKKGPQKSLRAKLCDLRVKTLYLRAIMLCIQLLLLLRRSLSFTRKNGSLWALG